MTDEKMQGNIIKNFLKNIEKMLAFRKNVLYNQTCCDMIALKREVAAGDQQVFRGANVKLGNWRQVTVPYNRLQRNAETTCENLSLIHISELTRRS